MVFGCYLDYFIMEKWVTYFEKIYTASLYIASLNMCIYYVWKWMTHSSFPPYNSLVYNPSLMLSNRCGILYTSLFTHNLGQNILLASQSNISLCWHSRCKTWQYIIYKGVDHVWTIYCFQISSLSHSNARAGIIQTIEIWMVQRPSRWDMCKFYYGCLLEHLCTSYSINEWCICERLHYVGWS